MDGSAGTCAPIAVGDNVGVFPAEPVVLTGSAQPAMSKATNSNKDILRTERGLRTFPDSSGCCGIVFFSLILLAVTVYQNSSFFRRCEGKGVVPMLGTVRPSLFRSALLQCSIISLDSDEKCLSLSSLFENVLPRFLP